MTTGFSRFIPDMQVAPPVAAAGGKALDFLRYYDRAARLAGLAVGTAAPIASGPLSLPLQLIPGVRDWLPDLTNVPEAFKAFREHQQEGDWDAAIKAYQDELDAGKYYWGAAEVAGAFVPTGGPALLGAGLTRLAPKAGQAFAKFAPGMAGRADLVEQPLRGIAKAAKIPWETENWIGRTFIEKPLRFAFGRTKRATGMVGSAMGISRKGTAASRFPEQELTGGARGTSPSSNAEIVGEYIPEGTPHSVVTGTQQPTAVDINKFLELEIEIPEIPRKGIYGEIGAAETERLTTWNDMVQRATVTAELRWKPLNPKKKDLENGWEIELFDKHHKKIQIPDSGNVANTRENLRFGATNADRTKAEKFAQSNGWYLIEFNKEGKKLRELLPFGRFNQQQLQRLVNDADVVESLSQSDLDTFGSWHIVFPDKSKKGIAQYIREHPDTKVSGSIEPGMNDKQALHVAWKYLRPAEHLSLIHI